MQSAFSIARQPWGGNHKQPKQLPGKGLYHKEPTFCGDSCLIANMALASYDLGRNLLLRVSACQSSLLEGLEGVSQAEEERGISHPCLLGLLSTYQITSSLGLSSSLRSAANLIFPIWRVCWGWKVAGVDHHDLRERRSLSGIMLKSAGLPELGGSLG